MVRKSFGKVQSDIVKGLKQSYAATFAEQELSHRQGGS